MAKSDHSPANTEKRFYQVLQDELDTIATLDTTDSFEIASTVIDAIASATTAEEIFAANESGPADMADYLNSPLGITEVRWMRSAERFKKGTLGFYGVINAVTPGGEKVLLSVGAPNVVASVRQLQKLGLFMEDQPFWITVKSRETINGNLYTVHAG
ncbi:MAG: hypothetical protein ACREBW_10315 [Candidatus Micrarchaeaceae archaeon]